ncbi:tetratricopeptide repeat protein [Flavobacterium endophyticum]|uniref:Tetratricopeptide repeat protein n=2 Tax=Flavobacterium endophyticum TaxID=1540163 RepID=A0A495MIE4_9FLAO|nr:tetratricopeptide repeat protein [Flavobacterium endophyticum]
MGLFGFFDKKENDSPAKEDLDKAKEYFDKGEFQESLRALSWGFKKDAGHKPLYRLAADSLKQLGGYDEQELLEAVYRDMRNAEGFDVLGSFYFEQQYYDMAQAFYEKAVELQPDNEEARHNLAICYARQFEVGKAVEVLKKSDLGDFWNMYFLNKCKLLDGQLDGVAEAVAGLRAVIDTYPNEEEIEIPRMKIVELEETLQRYNTVAEAQTHIRDWQYIQYGGVMLDFFEREDSDDYVAGGRYVASWGSNESIKAAAEKLARLADRLSVSFRDIAALPDRDSEIIGRLLARQLGIGFGTYSPESEHEGSLIVAADSSLLMEYQELVTIRNGQIVFSLNHSWLDAAAVTPDIIGFMTQTYVFPWNGGGFKLTDPEQGTLEETQPDSRQPEEIAADIFNAESEEPEADPHLEFYASRRDYLKGIGSEAGSSRYVFMIESPVPGSYFV